MNFSAKEIIEPILVFLGGSGLLSLVLSWLFNKRKTKAEVKKIAQETESGQIQSASLILSMAQSLIKDISAERQALQEENDRLEEVTDKLENKVKDFEHQIDQLKKEVSTLKDENAYLRVLVEKVQLENKLLKEDLLRIKQS